MKPTYNFLYEYYLRGETTGEQGEFNRRVFPKDFEYMKNKLKELEDEQSASSNGGEGNNKK